MADVIRDALEWLADLEAAYKGRAVTYSRGANSVVLTVTLGKTTARQLDQAGRLRTISTGRAYLIRPAELILGGTATSPEKGDRISDVDDAGNAETWEVQPLQNGEPHFTPIDYGKRLRVSVKRVAKAG